MIGARRWWLGLTCLVFGAAASAFLAGKALHLFAPPGCGEGSPCDLAAASLLGKVPLLEWPTSFVGLAYFAALAAGWIAAAASGAVPSALRWLVRAGVAASVMFLVAMIAGRYVCPYCVAAHLGNFGFLFAIESAPRRRADAGRILGWCAAAFVATTALEFAVHHAAGATARREAADITQHIAGAPTSDESREVPGTPAPRPPEQTAAPQGGAPFTGRYRLGPEPAPIRLVVFADFQCPECRQVEMELRTILKARSDVSVSMKQFPFCRDCNPIVTATVHANACWGARAAEAAGILRGNDGFWEMHHWLFDRKGAFTDAELKEALQDFGYEPAEFLKAMMSEEALKGIEADSREADLLGLNRTPMVFINGVEFRPWYVEGNLTRTIEALGSKNLTPRDAAQDRPPPAEAKYVGDWRFQPVVTPAPDARAWTQGPRDAPGHIVFWGDYQEPYCADADAFLRKIVAARTDASYTFRHYPICGECNSTVPASAANMHPLACRMAKAAEAAGAIGGSEGYWRMHDWLMANQKGFSDQALLEAAAQMGFDPAALLSAMESPEVAAEIAADAEAAKRLGMTSVPFILINNKLLPRWKMKGAVEAILDEAARKK
jgi:protein-disulfide isomerase